MNKIKEYSMVLFLVIIYNIFWGSILGFILWLSINISGNVTKELNYLGYFIVGMFYNLIIDSVITQFKECYKWNKGFEKRK